MKKKGKVILVTVLIILTVLAAGLAAAFYIIAGKGGYYALFASRDRTDIMEAFTYTDGNGTVLPYRLYRPETGQEDYPLVLFLHGSGEKGNDNEKQVQVNSVTDTLLNKKNRKEYPCYVVAPQCPEGEKWSVKLEEPGSFSRDREEPLLDALMGLVRELETEYPVDPDRIYVVGISMGGHAVWNLLSRESDAFAAAVPICGCGDSMQAENIKSIPIWSFHGAKDTTVPVGYSREMVKALEEAGAEDIRYTEYPGEKHQSWELAYREKELFPWLFAQRKK